MNPDNKDIIEFINEMNIINDDANKDEVISMIQALENGEEPLMLKICSGRATPEEISEWASTQGIDEDDIEEVLSMMSSSFLTGTGMAQEIEINPITPKIQNDPITLDPITLDPIPSVRLSNQKVLTRLELVLNTLDTLRNEVIELIHIVKN